MYTKPKLRVTPINQKCVQLQHQIIHKIKQRNAVGERLRDYVSIVNCDFHKGRTQKVPHIYPMALLSWLSFFIYRNSWKQRVKGMQCNNNNSRQCYSVKQRMADYTFSSWIKNLEVNQQQAHK